MDSESDDGFARQPGEAHDMGDEFDSEDREQNSEEEDEHPPLSTQKPQVQPTKSGPGIKA